jgi:hypothetical protein
MDRAGLIDFRIARDTKCRSGINFIPRQTQALWNGRGNDTARLIIRNRQETS